jgi:TolA-binding protein
VSEDGTPAEVSHLTVVRQDSAARQHRTDSATPRDGKVTPRAARLTAERTAVLDALELRAELELIDAARAALQRGDISAASAPLNLHRKRFEHGRLAQEATYLRMRLYLKQGNTVAARTTAEQILQLYPRGPHAARAAEVLKQ